MATVGSVKLALQKPPTIFTRTTSNNITPQKTHRLSTYRSRFQNNQFNL
jgi:hypothetical protein